MNRIFVFLATLTLLCFNAMAQRQMERLDRGLIAAKIGSTTNAFVSWRLFATDPTGVTFNLYRATSSTGAFSLVSNCSSLDAAHTNCTVSGGAGTDNRYQVAVLVNGTEVERSKAVAVWQTSVNNNGAYLEIPVTKPTGRLYDTDTKTFSTYTDYSIYDGSVADLDGDGEYEVVFFWGPANMKDNSQDGVTANVFIDAYKLNGTKLWGANKWIDLGPNIRAGAHYQVFLVYDFNGDGKAEIIVKTADGTKDALGTQIGNNEVYITPRNGYTRPGFILDGNEYISVFEGATGKLIDTKPYDPPRHPSKINPTPSELNSVWGDNYGNRVDRFVGAVAYLDGVNPSAVMVRGYYTRATAAAWDFDGKQLIKRWLFDTRNLSAADKTKYEGQGNHNLSVAEVNGKDIIITGSSAINSDGTPRYSRQTGHGDAIHAGKLNPDRAGLQVFRCLESSPYGVEMFDAFTGETIWKKEAGEDTGRALCADIDPNYPGEECWASNGIGIHSATGTLLGSQPNNLSINMAVWWDGDTGRETWDGTVIKVSASAGSGDNLRSYSRAELVTHSGATTIGGTKKNPVLQADILGDWREEIILPTTNSSALRIYTTTMATTHSGAGAIPSQGIPTLMQNKMYRLAVAWQNGGYNQPPHTDFFLGYNMTGQVPRDNIVYVGSGSSSSATPSSSSKPSSSSVAASSSSSRPSSSSIAASSSSIAAIASSSSAISSSSSSEDTTPIANHSPLAASHSPTYYSIKGEPLGSAKPQKAGIYIVKEGYLVKKIVVR